MISGWSLHKWRTTSAEPSVDPSSMTMISAGFTVCSSTLCIAASMYFSWLYRGITTDTRGTGTPASGNVALEDAGAFGLSGMGWISL